MKKMLNHTYRCFGNSRFVYFAGTDFEARDFAAERREAEENRQASGTSFESAAGKASKMLERAGSGLKTVDDYEELEDLNLKPGKPVKPGSPEMYALFNNEDAAREYIVGLTKAIESGFSPQRDPKFAALNFDQFRIQMADYLARVVEYDPEKGNIDIAEAPILGATTLFTETVERINEHFHQQEMDDAIAQETQDWPVESVLPNRDAKTHRAAREYLERSKERYPDDDPKVAEMRSDANARLAAIDMKLRDGQLTAESAIPERARVLTQFYVNLTKHVEANLPPPVVPPDVVAQGAGRGSPAARRVEGKGTELPQVKKNQLMLSYINGERAGSDGKKIEKGAVTRVGLERVVGAYMANPEFDAKLKAKQKEWGVKADGIFGPASFEKAKERPEVAALLSGTPAETVATAEPLPPAVEIPVAKKVEIATLPPISAKDLEIKAGPMRTASDEFPKAAPDEEDLAHLQSGQILTVYNGLGAGWEEDRPVQVVEVDKGANVVTVRNPEGETRTLSVDDLDGAEGKDAETFVTQKFDYEQRQYSEATRIVDNHAQFAARDVIFKRTVEDNSGQEIPSGSKAQILKTPGGGLVAVLYDADGTKNQKTFLFNSEGAISGSVADLRFEDPTKPVAEVAAYTPIFTRENGIQRQVGVTKAGGEVVAVLQRSPKGGLLKIRTSDGAEGYVKAGRVFTGTLAMRTEGRDADATIALVKDQNRAAAEVAAADVARVAEEGTGAVVGAVPAVAPAPGATTTTAEPPLAPARATAVTAGEPAPLAGTDSVAG